jgi:hypothetical protein
MLDGERVGFPTAEEAQAMGELEPHTLVPVTGVGDKSGPAFGSLEPSRSLFYIVDVNERRLANI